MKLIRFSLILFVALPALRFLPEARAGGGDPLPGSHDGSRAY